MSTFNISGTGTHALTSNTTSLHLDITTLPGISGLGRANPASHYDVGLIRFSDGTGYWAPVAINGGPQWVGVPIGATSIGYSVFGSGVVAVTEVIGGTSPFAGSVPSLEQLTDVSVSSIANGQILEWDSVASLWKNVTPTAGPAASSQQLGSDVSISSVGPYFSGPSLTLSAGAWLIVGQAVIACGGTTTVGFRFTDGTNPAPATTFATSGTSATGQTAMLAIDLSGTTTITLEANSTFSGCTLKASAATVGMSKVRTTLYAFPIA